jgi:DNA-binding NtrC family response regulator
MTNPRDEKPVVLCVDDDPLVLRSLERLLRNEPVDVLTTLHPEIALRWVEDHDVRLLMTDQRMPGMSGTRLIEEVACRSPNTACVLLTAYPLDTAVLPDFLQGTYGLIAKPWDGPMLRSMIRQVLREGQIEDQEDRRTSGE